MNSQSYGKLFCFWEPVVYDVLDQVVVLAVHSASYFGAANFYFWFYLKFLFFIVLLVFVFYSNVLFNLGNSALQIIDELASSSKSPEKSQDKWQLP